MTGNSQSENWTPEWVRHAIFYQIFPDRFASSSRVVKPSNLEAWDAAPTGSGFKGGDLLGVAEHLDYLMDLGVNAIYFTPIFQSASNHRYHTHDYFKVDPLLGGNEAFRELLAAAHARGMRVVLDGVFNHASRGFFQFNHILETGSQSPYVDWFTVYKYPLHAYEGQPNYKCWWNLAALPSFNTDNPQVRQFIFDVARYWIEQGIDGWRLDVPFEIKDPSFWQEFRQVVKSANPEAYITGEIPWDATEWLQGDQFDAVMNYLLSFACWGFFGGSELIEEHVGHWRGHGPEMFTPRAEDFARNMTVLLNKYPRAAMLSQLNLLDSHDTSRFQTMVNGRKDLQKLAALFLMTYPGAPCIYYGDEIGMDGGKDPACRRGFIWDSAHWDHHLRDFYKKAIQIRKAHPALQTGEWKALFAAGEVLVTQNTLKDDQVISIFNRSTLPFVLDIALDQAAEKAVLKDLYGTGEAVMQNGRLSGITIQPFSAAVLA